MFEIDPKLLENVEKQLNIGSPLKFIIGFTDKYFVIAKRGGIQSVAKTEQEDPLKPGESRFVNVHTFSVIELPEGGHSVQTQTLKGENTFSVAPATTRSVAPKELPGNPPPPNSCGDGSQGPPCRSKFRIG